MAMARAIERLTALKIEKAKKPGMYADGGGLYLRVTPKARAIGSCATCSIAGRDGWD
jgi:hypothetical protein